MGQAAPSTGRWRPRRLVTLPPTSCVKVGKIPDLSEPPFFHLHIRIIIILS